MYVVRHLTYLLPLAASACGGSDLVLPNGQGPTQLLVVRGDQQQAVAGRALPDPLIVRLVDTLGRPIAGREVSWSVLAGAGTIIPTIDTTDSDGLATTHWILGADPGANAVRAVVANVVFVTFTAVGTSDSGALPQPSATRSTISADPGSIPVASGTSTIAVEVKDERGNPVEGATVSLEASGSGNSLTQPTATSDAGGRVIGTLSSTDAGTKIVSATVNGSVRLTRTVEVAVVEVPEPTMERQAGDGQSAPAGSPVAVSPAVKVTDGQGHPIAGVRVTFTVTGGGGSVSGATPVTNGQGIAQLGSWSLGSVPGTNTLEATAASVRGSPLVFTADGTVGSSVDHLVFRLQPHDVSTNEQFRVEVALVDKQGNVVPLSGILIYLGLFEEGKDSPDNTRLAGERFRDTQDGVAVFDDLAVEKDGTYRLRALTDQLPELGPHGPEPYLFSIPFTVR